MFPSPVRTPVYTQSYDKRNGGIQLCVESYTVTSSTEQRAAHLQDNPPETEWAMRMRRAANRSNTNLKEENVEAIIGQLWKHNKRGGMVANIGSVDACVR